MLGIVVDDDDSDVDGADVVAAVDAGVRPWMSGSRRSSQPEEETPEKPKRRKCASASAGPTRG